jgi:hypothetical protein
MPQAAIANGTTKPAASHAASILPAFQLATGLFPPMSILGLPGPRLRLFDNPFQVDQKTAQIQTVNGGHLG